MRGEKIILPALTHEHSLKTLVENRTVFTLNECELNLFETYQQSDRVPLKFNDLVVTSMLRGKKVMHLFDDPSFDYLPGETVMVPSNVQMHIDFPEASRTNPTQCLALAIDHEKIMKTIDYLNENYPKEGEGTNWVLNFNDYFFYNNTSMAKAINKLIHVCMGTDLTKDILADLALQELIVHIIQTQTLNGLSNQPDDKSGILLTHIVRYIREHLNSSFNMGDLTNEACMSTASFYRWFKREVGMTPNEFVAHERIKVAKKLLSNPGIQINEVCYEAGFQDSNYFIRVFKKIEGITPKQYQKCVANQSSL